MNDWISEAVIYQINWRTIAAREPRNPLEAADEAPPSGSTIAHVQAALPGLAELGVNLLYVTPPYPCGLAGGKGMGSPYAVRDFYAISPEHGTKEEFAELVRAAHERGMKLILDITPNHTSRDHGWIREHPEFHVREAGGRAVYDCDWYDTAKLNYRSAGLRKAMQDVFLHWLSFLGRDADGKPDGVDGFRLDMAHLLNDLSFWDDLVPVLRDSQPGRKILLLAESYGFPNNWGLFERGINAAYDDDFYKVCQYGYAVGADGGTVVALDPAARHNGDFSDKLAAFETGGIAGAMARVLAEYEERSGGPGGAPWLARYTDNHDEGRGLHRFGAGGTRAAMQLAFLAPRSLPFILAGQEFGAVNRPTIHARMGTCDKGPRIIRDGRTDRAAGIEFQGNLFAPSFEERRAWYAFYRELIALRATTSALTRGEFRIVDAGERAAPAQRTVIAFERRHGSTVLRCAVNLGPEPRDLEKAGLFAGAPRYGRLQGSVLQPFSAVAAVAG